MSPVRDRANPLSGLPQARDVTCSLTKQPVTSVSESPLPVVFLFTDIEGSTRLWESEPERMQAALAHHDALSRAAIACNRGSLVKSTGDGVHAAFADALGALDATLAIQFALAEPGDAAAVSLTLRCGLHAGVVEQRDGDFYGRAVNRAARVMSAAHGGQILLSQAVVDQLSNRLPEGASLRALGRVRLRDLASPEDLYQLVHPRLRADFPALRSLEATPNNLKQQLNSFVGRERELAEARRRLADCRLLTLLGMGGIGKSRMSAQLAADVLDDFPDGVWLIELASLSDPAAVARALARVLGVKEEADRSIVESLQRHVRDRSLLIVLDNCEHLLAACAALAKALLEAGPQVKLLATSRDPLQVAGEISLQVPTLSVPSAHTVAAAAPESLLRHEGVRLFVDRAGAAQPGFRVDARTAESVAMICSRLDGIALAIELAAARVRTLSVETIAERLDDRFRLLVSGDSTVPPRQRTLRALIDWSYDLLPRAERIVFDRLAVFAGGWTLDAAESVLADDTVSNEDVLDLLAHLVEKSLVRLEPDNGRYRMLDTVRAYALEKLESTGDAAATRTRHLSFFVGLAEQARPELFGPQQGEWLRKLDEEGENLLAAHAWCGTAQDGAHMDLRLVFSLKFYWLNRGLLALGHQVSGEALAREGARERNFERSRGLCDFGQLCFYLGRYDEAQRHLVESLEIARQIGDSGRVLAALQPLGMSAIGQGDVRGARTYLEEAVLLAEGQDNKRQLAAALNALGQLDRVEGRTQSAEQTYVRVVTLARELGDQESIAIGLLNLAMVAVDRGANARAACLLIEVLDIAKAIGSQPAAQSALDVAAALAVQVKDWRRALCYFDAAEVQAARTGLRRDPADQAFIAPRLEQMRKQASPAEAARARHEHLPFEQVLAELSPWLLAQCGTTTHS